MKAAILHPLSLVMGFVFGFAMERGKVMWPEVIRSQMLLQSFSMMKMFLSASAASMFIIGLLVLFRLADRQVRPAVALGFGWMKGYGGNVIGGLLLGIGMTVTGSCPGTVYSQIGAGVKSAPFVLLGGLLGGILYAYVHTALSTTGFARCHIKHSLDSVLKQSYTISSIVAAFVFVAVIAALEVLYPWRQDIMQFGITAEQTGLTLQDAAWPPYVSGSLIGFLQIPAFVLIGSALGTSTAYPTVGAWFLKRVDRFAGSVLKTSSFSPSLGSAWWQVTLAIGSISGGFVSTLLSGLPYPNPSPVSWIEAILGGMLLIFGSRLAGGCTSGHGISGFAQLSTASLISTAMMFVGAIGSAFLFYA